MQVEEQNGINGQKPSKFDEYENQILLNQLEQQKNKKLEKKVEIDKKFINSQENKNLIRYLNLVVDLTHTMNIQDLKPSRLSLTIQNLDVFVKQFFDKNPLSMLGLAVCKDGVCQQLIDFSSNADTFLSIIGHPRSQIRQVSDKGDFSLQYLIEEQIRQFIDAPLYANKEVLVIQSSPCTIDTGRL
ncbi:hypothetical protein PPERSA_03459 [Pseudocohnilembus persalinus]|uniref:Ssl1-like domain-containing protein n=1 Tax=Pseudocohnilembus persalinus TaxID=266149 RepID=A0A0V0QBX8_PSEPJ|nr:hypothetical protein PPERSA_03459 [Pseudocohnilembus persalinus]|eukprot:KRW99658.1 hypothetical protein PPERSA_03459 [Pseudocohnilembus persalinus]